MYSPTSCTRRPFDKRRARRRRSAAVHDTLLAPPSRLTVDEAAALLRLPRRAMLSDLEWLAPGCGDVLEGARVHERPSVHA